MKTENLLNKSIYNWKWLFYTSKLLYIFVDHNCLHFLSFKDLLFIIFITEQITTPHTRDLPFEFQDGWRHVLLGLWLDNFAWRNTFQPNTVILKVIHLFVFYDLWCNGTIVGITKTCLCGRYWVVVEGGGMCLLRLLPNAGIIL